jgi:hypothetical protein
VRHYVVSGIGLGDLCGLVRRVRCAIVGGDCGTFYWRIEMTVKELIEKLGKYGPDLEVTVDCVECGPDLSIQIVRKDDDGGVEIIIE